MADQGENFESSTEEKLYSLHKEIEKLTNTCRSNNLSYFQIKQSAKPFLKFEKNKNGSKLNVARTSMLAICVCIIAILLKVETPRRLVHSYGRHALIKVIIFYYLL